MTTVHALNLVGSTALERVELHIELASLPRAHEWVFWTLRSIVSSPAFNEFVIWVRSGDYEGRQVDINGWKTVESSLCALAESNPDFRVVFKGDPPSFLYAPWGIYDRARLFFETHLPAVLSKGFARIEYVPRVDNPCWELHSL